MINQFTDAMQEAITKAMYDNYKVELTWTDSFVKIRDKDARQMVTYQDTWKKTLSDIDRTARLMWLRRQQAKEKDHVVRDL